MICGHSPKPNNPMRFGCGLLSGGIHAYFVILTCKDQMDNGFSTLNTYFIRHREAR